MTERYKKYIRKPQFDDFNQRLICRHCKKTVEADEYPDTCPYCGKEFESIWDFIVRMAGYAMVILIGIYLWQKVMIGL